MKKTWVGWRNGTVEESNRIANEIFEFEKTLKADGYTRTLAKNDLQPKQFKTYQRGEVATVQWME